MPRFKPKTSSRRRSWSAPKYPEQSTRQRERGKRYANYTSALTGLVTHGLKAGAERGLVPRPTKQSDSGAH